MFCLNCGNKLAKYQTKFCNVQCQRSWDWKQRVEQIESFGALPFSDDGNRRTGRRYFLEKYGNRCSVCELSHWMGKAIPLVLDHIDGNSENWRLSNLRLICCNCDAQTDTYKSRNRGNGRHMRRQRYAAGKSF